MDQAQDSYYDAVGGHATFAEIVSRFYQLVADDEILRPMYPEQELRVAEWITGAAGSSCTTSALPHSTMTIARRNGNAVSGS